MSEVVTVKKVNTVVVMQCISDRRDRKTAVTVLIKVNLVTITPVVIVVTKIQ